MIQQDKVFAKVYIPRSLQELSLIDILQEEKMGVETYYEKLTGIMKPDEDQEGVIKPEEQELANKQYFKENFTSKNVEESVDKIK